jgi:hypothetical protein
MRGALATAAMLAARFAAAAAAVVCACELSAALETDQYYAWTVPLDDSADVIDAKINREMALVLEEIDGPDERTCREISRTLMRRMRFVIFQPIQLWIDNVSLIDRYPATPEQEFAYRRESIYPYSGLADIGVSIPPSPTIEVDGIRIGTDKIAHFFSNGWRYYERYRHARSRGLTEEAAVERALRKGFVYERTVLGYALSGVLSIADLEANERGMQFFRSLCEGDRPRFERRGDRWVLARRFSIDGYVTPEWDESWRPSVYTDFRWRRVRQRLVQYCPGLDHPDVRTRRARYALRDDNTLTDRLVDQLVAEGRIEEPAKFSIEAVCEQQRADRETGR